MQWMMWAWDKYCKNNEEKKESMLDISIIKKKERGIFSCKKSICWPRDVEVRAQYSDEEFKGKSFFFISTVVGI